MAVSHVGSVWEQAVFKQEARRDLGRRAGKKGLNEGVFLDDLRDIGLILLQGLPKKEEKKAKGSRQNFATVVVGLWLGDKDYNVAPHLFIVTKLADVSLPKKTEAFQLAQQKLIGVRKEDKLIDDERQMIIIDEISTNLHAEMAIIRWLNKNNVGKHCLKDNLEIYCAGKGVCLDCSGWLTKHGIRHAPLSGAPSPTAWKNPITDSLFRASGEKLEYTKGFTDQTLSGFNKNFGGPYKDKSETNQ